MGRTTCRRLGQVLVGASVVVDERVAQGTPAINGAGCVSDAMDPEIGDGLRSTGTPAKHGASVDGDRTKDRRRLSKTQARYSAIIPLIIRLRLRWKLGMSASSASTEPCH